MTRETKKDWPAGEEATEITGPPSAVEPEVEAEGVERAEPARASWIDETDTVTDVDDSRPVDIEDIDTLLYCPDETQPISLDDLE